MTELLEELSLNAWPAIKVLHYDNWVIRFAGGHTRRSNSVNVLGPSSVDLREKIAYCERAYTEAGQPTIFKFAGISGTHELEGFLASSGYISEATTSVMTRDLNSLIVSPKHNVRIESAMSANWFREVVRLTEVPVYRWPVLETMLRSIVPTHCYASIYESGVPVAFGTGVVERGWVGLFDIVTSPEHRRQGLGLKLVQSLLAWGQDNGAHSSYLQVMQDNRAAIGLYSKLGFDRKYDYWYRVKRNA